MTVYISTNMFAAGDFKNIFSLLDQYAPGELGVEIFPLLHKSAFRQNFLANAHLLKNIPNSFHGAYYFTEHSAKRGREIYLKSMDNLKRTFEYAQMIESQFVVFHHNNCFVEKRNKKQMLKYAAENLQEINALAKEYSLSIVVENAGVTAMENVLFNESEFIALFNTIENNCLLDIGHLNCNSWNMLNVIGALNTKITAYHVHNNKGCADSHKRLREGTLDINCFFKLYRKFTPGAKIILEYAPDLDISLQDVVEDINFVRENI